MRQKYIVAGLLASASWIGVSGASAATLTLDGKLDATYQLGFSVGFIDEAGKAIGDGKAYFGIGDDAAQYFYFQMPLAYVDNTYGTNAAADWGKKGHSFNDLLGSDSLGSDKKGGVPLSWTEESGAKVEGQADYIAGISDGSGKKATITGYTSGGFGNVPGATEKNDGALSLGSLANLLGVATSLEYNLKNVDPSAITDSSLLAGWINEVGYEFKFAAGTFDAAMWLDKDSALTLINFGSPHVSPSKRTFAEYGDPVCVQGCEPPPSPVPLPASLPLLLAALSGVGFLGRRSRRRRDLA